MKNILPRFLLAAVLAYPAIAATADEALQSCRSCHALEKPDYENAASKAAIDIKAPPLFYAGNKFRREWLVEWLQKPVRIRPAGYIPENHTITKGDKDIINKQSLTTHPRLNEEEAGIAADALLAMTPYNEKIDAVDYQPGNIAWRMGQMNFGKFNNCIGCHQDEPGYGGLSGPELYTAWDRLQPAFIASFIDDPTAWNPRTAMPASDLQPAAIQKLADYLKVIAEE